VIPSQAPVDGIATAVARLMGEAANRSLFAQAANSCAILHIPSDIDASEFCIGWDLVETSSQKHAFESIVELSFLVVAAEGPPDAHVRSMFRSLLAAVLVEAGFIPVDADRTVDRLVTDLEELHATDGFDKRMRRASRMLTSADYQREALRCALLIASFLGALRMRRHQVIEDLARSFGFEDA
jgi:hypothetical protein